MYKFYKIFGVLIFFLTFTVLIPVDHKFIIKMDMAWGPNYPPPNWTQSNAILQWLLYISPNWLSASLQKIILFSIFVLLFRGMFKLIEINTHINSKAIKYVAALVSITNLFVVTRFVAGQWLVLFSVAILPWVMLTTLKLLKDPSWKSSLKLLLWLILLSWTSIHAVGIAILFIVVTYSVHLIGSKERSSATSLIKYLLAIIGAWCIANSWWLIAIFNKTSTVANQVQTFGESQFTAFMQTGTLLHSPVLSTLLLTGFWADQKQKYALSSGLDHFGWWTVFGTILLLFVGVGWYYSVVRKRQLLAMSLFISSVISIILAIGVSSPATNVATQFLIQHVPFYAGYRDSSKWLILVAISYAYFAAYGAYWIAEIVKRRYKQPDDVLPWTIYTLPVVASILLTMSVIGPAVGDLHLSRYPDGWKQAAQYLNQQPDIKEPDKPKILVLPWHQYMYYDFTGATTPNLARYYFKQSLVVGNNSELKGVPPINRTPLEAYVNVQLIPEGKYDINAAQKLSIYGIRYIMLEKQADFRSYSWLNNQRSLTKVFDNSSITIYKTGTL